MGWDDRLYDLLSRAGIMRGSSAAQEPFDSKQAQVRSANQSQGQARTNHMQPNPITMYDAPPVADQPPQMRRGAPPVDQYSMTPQGYAEADRMPAPPPAPGQSPAPEQGFMDERMLSIFSQLPPEAMLRLLGLLGQNPEGMLTRPAPTGENYSGPSGTLRR